MRGGGAFGPSTSFGPAMTCSGLFGNSLSTPLSASRANEDACLRESVGRWLFGMNVLGHVQYEYEYEQEYEYDGDLVHAAAFLGLFSQSI